MSTMIVENKPKLIPFTVAGRRAKGQCEPVVFWVRTDGEIMVAPHTDMKPLPLYARVECNTVSSIDAMSKKMAAQEEYKMRGLQVEERLRALPKWQEIAAKSRRRLEEGCISAADEAMTRNNLASVERKMTLLEKLLIGELNLTEGALEIERTEAKVGMAQFGGKKVVI